MSTDCIRALPCFSCLSACGALMLALGEPVPARATEGGATAFPNGGEDFLVGAMPPPGVYGVLYFTHYSAERLNDGTGAPALPRFDLTVNAVTLRLDWVKPVTFMGADLWGTLFALPFLDMDLSLSPAPGVLLQGSKRGMADLAIGNGLHWKFGKFEMINSADVGIPIGSYDESRLINPGLNHWVARVNTIGTWFPTPQTEFSYRLHWDYNFTNSATGYRSGQTIYLNWAAGWKPNPRTTIGVVGYFLRQITDDEIDGVRTEPDGNRLRSAGIGPVVKIVGPGGVFITAKYLHDFDVRNRPVGETFWFYLAKRL